jgi:hypothetical protein
MRVMKQRKKATFSRVGREAKSSVGLLLLVTLLYLSTPTMSTSEYLRTLPAIRERCSKVFALGQQGKLEYFTYHQDKEAEVVEYCTNIIKVSTLYDSPSAYQADKG